MEPTIKPCICGDDGGALCPRHDLLERDYPAPDAAHVCGPFITGAGVPSYCRECGKDADTDTALREAAQKALGSLNMISPSGWHVERAREALMSAGVTPIAPETVKDASR